MRRVSTLSVLRTIAIVIALTAAADPAITSNRRAKPDIAVIAADPRADSALADRVARVLGGAFTVYRSPMPAAAGTVVVGGGVPSSAPDLARPVFAVLPPRDTPMLVLEHVGAPSWAPRAGRVTVDATARVVGARGRTLDLTLRGDGVTVDRVTHTVAADDERFRTTLGYVPTSIGSATLRVAATLPTVPGVPAAAAADLVVDVRDTRWSVLFYDPRPSWMSTFVRRAVERDPRFVVTSRVVTSRNVSTDAGDPPARLDQFGTLSSYDAVVVGAPETLGERDVAGLESFMRKRGGSVVLLLDRYAPGPYARLTGVVKWTADSVTKAVSIATADGTALRATELVWPTTLPAGAEARARTPDSASRAVAGRPIVWRSSVGAGNVIVSGALDAWRFRDRPASEFDTFWRSLIAGAASDALPPIEATLSNAVVEPGERVRLSVSIRDAALAATRPVKATVSVSIEPRGDTAPPTPVRVFADALPGEFGGVIDAPAAPGTYRVVVSSGAERAAVPLVVTRDLARPAPAHDRLDLLNSWVAARGGRVIPNAEIASLENVLGDAVHAAQRLETWNPMRSAWWIVPFALALSGEWWLRRRRGSA
jgi:hypothetical protein